MLLCTKDPPCLCINLRISFGQSSLGPKLGWKNMVLLCHLISYHPKPYPPWPTLAIPIKLRTILPKTIPLLWPEATAGSTIRPRQVAGDDSAGGDQQGAAPLPTLPPGGDQSRDVWGRGMAGCLGRVRVSTWGATSYGLRTGFWLRKMGEDWGGIAMDCSSHSVSRRTDPPTFPGAEDVDHVASCLTWCLLKACHVSPGARIQADTRRKEEMKKAVCSADRPALDAALDLARITSSTDPMRWAPM